MSKTLNPKKRLPDPIKQIQIILHNLENGKKENKKDFSNFLYLRQEPSREFDFKNGVKIFGIKGPEESVYEV